MKKIINAFRDFIYNITDYGMILTVVIIMAAILIWRFDILFGKEIDKHAIADNTPVQQQPENPSNPDPSGNSGNEESPPVDETNPGGKPVDNTPEVVAHVEIPQGAYPSKIGDILISSNIIDDKNEFLNRSIEMGLDTKLQSGTFEITIGTPLDDVIKIIAKAN